MVPVEEPRIDYATPQQMPWRDWAGAVGLGVGLVLLALVIVWPSVPVGMRWRWARHGSPINDRDIWPIVKWGSAAVAVLAGFSVLRSLKGRHRPRILAVMAVALAVASPAVLSLRGWAPPDRDDGYNFTYCSSRLSSIFKVAYLYANDHAGRLPDRIEDGMAADQYDEVAILDCPVLGGQVTRRTPGVRPTAPSDYLYFGKGLDLATITAAHVVACDRPANHDREGYDLWVVYGDGRVGDVTRERLVRIVADLEAGVNPPGP
jgi:hypothetical protein